MSIESILNKKYQEEECKFLPLNRNRTTNLDKNEPFTSFAYMLSKISIRLDEASRMVLSYLDAELSDPNTSELIGIENKETMVEQLKNVQTMHSRLRSSLIRIIEEKK